MDRVTAHQPRPWMAVGLELADLLGRLESEPFETVCQMLANEDQRWFFAAQGRSGLVAAMIAMRFMHLGRRSHLVGEATAPSVEAGDGILFISGSGETPVTIHHASVARNAGARVVVVTASPRSTLAAEADVVLPIPVLESMQLGGGLFEQAALIVLDAALLAIASGESDARAKLVRLHTNMQ